jgi:hypothetical protein
LLAGLVAGGLAVTRAVTTLNGVELALICGVASATVGIAVYLELLRRFKPVIHEIVGGRKRIAVLSAEISLGLAGLITFSALYLNRNLASAPPITVEATVERVNRVSGPKLWGWDATFRIDDDTYYQMVSPEVAMAAMQSQVLVLKLQPGALGYSYIISATAR